MANIHYHAKRSALIRNYKAEIQRNDFAIAENKTLIAEFQSFSRQNTTTERELAKLVANNLRLETRNEHLKALVENLQQPAENATQSTQV